MPDRPSIPPIGAAACPAQEGSAASHSAQAFGKEPAKHPAQFGDGTGAAGLIIGEATAISRQGMGWPCAPGIWSDAQVAAWQAVTAKVHRAGGHILCQLWHMGRQVHPDYLGGAPQVAPAIRRIYPGPLVLNSDYDGARAEAALWQDAAEAVSFGRAFLANPDLPHRLAARIPLAKDDKETWYAGGAEGYTDYPSAGERDRLATVESGAS